MLNGNTDGDDASLGAVKEFVVDALKSEYIPKRNLCLEIGCGGPLLLYDSLLIELFYRVDICDISRTQMLATYEAEDDINSRRASYMVGVIEDRLQQNFKDVSLQKPYDLVIARWGLGYLDDREVVSFLRRCNGQLLNGGLKDTPNDRTQRGGSDSNPSPMIFMETIMDSGKPNRRVGKQNLHLRTEEWYLQTFAACNYKV